MPQKSVHMVFCINLSIIHLFEYWVRLWLVPFNYLLCFPFLHLSYAAKTRKTITVTWLWRFFFTLSLEGITEVLTRDPSWILKRNWGLYHWFVATADLCMFCLKPWNPVCSMNVCGVQKERMWHGMTHLSKRRRRVIMLSSISTARSKF